MYYSYMLIGILAAIHAFAFGRWLIKAGNKFGGWLVYLFAAACLALPLYRIIK